MIAQDILLRNNINVCGTGPQTIMFAHGLGCDQTIWRLVAPSFTADYRVVLFDYVGAGKSQRNAYSFERYSSLIGYAQDVLDICKALKLSQITFVGHSISGLIGLLASLQAPERFARLIMIGSSPCYINDLPEYLGGFDRAEVEGLLDLMERNYSDWANFLAPKVMQNTDQPELTSELTASFLSTDMTIMRQFAEVAFFADYRDSLPQATVPAYILQASSDMIVPNEAALYMYHHIPLSILHMMQAHGHYPQLSAPVEITGLIRAYLEQS